MYYMNIHIEDDDDEPINVMTRSMINSNMIYDVSDVWDGKLGVFHFSSNIFVFTYPFQFALRSMKI